MGAIGIGTPIYYHSTPIRPGAVVDKPEFVFEVLVSNVGDTIDLETFHGSSGAPNFKINWGEGSDQTLSTTTTSHTYTSTGTKVIKINKSGTNTPVNNFSVLATNQGRAMVTKVTDWGDNEWYSLRDGFNSCVNLTTISSDTTLLTASNASELFYNTFRDCTSLTDADMSSWATNNIVWYLRGTFHGCTNVNLVKAPASRKMPLSLFGTAASQQFNNSAFRYVGSATDDGATFEFGGLDFSDTSLVNITTCFANAKINGNTSDFSDWIFPSTVASITNLFYFAQVVGTDPIFDCSGWTTLQANNLAGAFRGINNTTAPNNLTLNISNFNVSNVTNFGLFMGHNFSINRISNIIGLSTWGATPGGVAMGYFFANMNYLKLTSSDNFSDVFINSLTPTTLAYSFYNIGSSLSSGDFGEPPNLASLDLSNSNTLDAIFFGSHFSSLPDFTNVTFPTAAVSWANFLRNISTESVTSHLDLSNKTFKPTSLSRAFENFKSANKITFPSGSNSDLSSLTSFLQAFNSAGSSTAELEVILPTDADYSAVTSWANAFQNLNGPGTVNLTTCVVNTLIRRLKATALTGNGQLIDLDQSNYSGSPALIGNDLAELQTATPSYTFGTLSPEDPYFSIPNYISPGGTTQNITFATGVATDGTWTVTNGVATIDNSTPASPTITAAANGGGVIRYTLTDGCYNEVNFTATIPLIANNFSFNFDGTSQYMEVDGDPLKISGVQQNQFTISAWINFDGAGEQFQVVGGMRNTTRPFSYGIRLNGSTATGPWKPVFLLSSAADSTNNYQVYANDNITPDEWTHVACVADGTASPNTSRMKLYINGQLQTDTVNWQDGNVQPSENPLMLGAYQLPAPVGSYFAGKTDEWALWNTPLTGPQILDIYNGRLGVTNETIDLSKYDGLGGNLVYWNRMGD